MTNYTPTPEAVEAAARAFAELGPGEDWPTNEALGGNLTGTRDDEYRAEMEDAARRALTAAGPIIAAQAWDEGAQSGLDTGLTIAESVHANGGVLDLADVPHAPVNPYRKEANHG